MSSDVMLYRSAKNLQHAEFCRRSNLEDPLTHRLHFTTDAGLYLTKMAAN